MTDLSINPDSLQPSHHASLTDGTKTLRLTFVTQQRDGTVEKDQYNVQDFPLQQQAVKMTSGSNKYSDAEWPYTPIAQDDWSGGRGNKTFELDQSRYADGYMVNTEKPNEVVLAGEPHYMLFNSTHPTYSAMAWNAIGGNQYDVSKEVPLYGDNRYLSDYFRVTTATNFWNAEVWIRKVGTPGNLTIAIYSDGVGNPYLIQEADALATVDPATISDILSFQKKVTFPTSVALLTGTDYWLVVYGAATDNAANHWNLLVKDAPSNGKKSADGTVGSWTVGNVSIPFRVKTYDFYMKGLFFEYKKMTYLITQPDSGASSKLYSNGDRGAADSNAADKTLLTDATKSWTADEWLGCWVKITNGPGSKEPNPYRYIYTNDGTHLYCRPDWEVTHTTDTEYVILGSNTFLYNADLGYYVTDVAVQGDWVYFARSESYQILRWWEYNNGGTWTGSSAAEPYYAEKLLLIRNVDSGDFELYGSENHHWFYRSAVWKANIPRLWGNLYSELGVLAEVNTPWDSAAAIANVTHGCNYAANWNTVAAAFTTGYIAYHTLPQALDCSGSDRLVFIMHSTVATSAGDLKIRLTDTPIDPVATPVTPSVATWSDAGNYDSYDVPALVINNYTWVDLDISPAKVTGNIDYSKITGVAIYLNADLGAQVVSIQFPLTVTRGIQEYITLPPGEYVQKLVPYSGDVNDPRENPWVITEDAVYEIQTQNGNKLVPLPIGEIKAMASENTGRSTAVNDVYLYFSLGDDKLQRYYSRNLDDIGPDRDDGLPANRRGKPSAILSLPGRVIVAIDAGASGYSSVLALNGQAYCEIYRSQRIGERIRGLHFQVIPGTNVGRLLITENSDVLWIPIAFDPTKIIQDYPERYYSFTHEGSLETSWIYGGMQSLYKIWRSLKLFLEDVVTSSQFIQVDYKLDASAAWTVISGDFDTSPMDEQYFTAASPPNVKSRRIKLRLRFNTYDHLLSPKLLAMVVEAFTVATVRYGYRFTTILSEDFLMPDLNGTEDYALGYGSRVETADAVLKDWASSGTPLTFNCIYSPFHNKTVLIDPRACRPVTWRKADNQEEHLLDVTVNEI